MGDDVKPHLRTPNENRWYLLATVYGEQPEPAKNSWFDEDLAAKNRTAWNRWMASALSEEESARLLQKDFSKTELTPFSTTER